jgi:hypothetical protein
LGVGELSEDFRGPRVRRVSVLVGLWGLALGWSERAFRPFAVIGRQIVMLRCGLLKETFAATAKARHYSSSYAHF